MRPGCYTVSTTQGYGGRLKALLFPVMDMFGRAFGVIKFGEASAYGFLLTTLDHYDYILIVCLRRKDAQG